MELIVDTTKPAPLVIGETGVAEILQNVRIILSTIRGTVPFDRLFGLTITYIDKPIPEAMAEFRGDAIQTVQKYEPRVSVTSVDFKAKPDEAMDGRLYPVVRVRIKDGAI
ncbi:MULTISPECIES: GPW/gp25 family protein [unclassified Maridesulfovibrio]|uniref:GPW/gp25 family protein n=1 Tax=unclassified Maridesulfovibrio TaxID=2794999 RepID=UPI003B4255EA